jgi:hypothetical protein
LRLPKLGGQYQKQINLAVNRLSGDVKKDSILILKREANEFNLEMCMKKTEYYGSHCLYTCAQMGHEMENCPELARVRKMLTPHEEWDKQLQQEWDASMLVIETDGPETAEVLQGAAVRVQIP